jgi:hypothetical protein
MIRRPARAAFAAFLLALVLPASAAAFSSPTATSHLVSPDAERAELGVGGGGDTVVAYQEDVTGGSAIFARRLGRDGVLGAPVRISPDGEDQSTLTVSVAADGRAFIAWRTSPGPASVRGRWLEVDGTPGPLLTLVTGQNSGAATDIDAVALGSVLGTDGRVTVFFVNQDNNASDQNELGLRRVAAAGGLFPAAGPLRNVSLDDSVDDAVAVPLPGGGTFFAWRGTGIEGAVVGVAEVLPAALTDISTSAGLVAGPSVDVDATGRSTVAWRRTTPVDQYAVIGRRIGADGNPTGTEFTLSAPAEGFLRISTPVTAAPAGETLTGWLRQFPGNDALASVRGRSAGGALQPVLPAFSDPARSVDRLRLASDDLGSAYAAWSYDGAGAQAFVQPFSFAGAALAPPVLLDAAEETALERMQLAGDGLGAALVIRFQAQRAVLLRQLIPPPGTCTDAAAATTAPTPVTFAVACTGVQVRPEVLTAPARGTASIGADGRVTYTPAAGTSGTDTFTVRAINAAGITGGSATVTVNVAPAPPPPPAADRTAPRITKASLSPKHFRAGGSGARAAARKRVPAGTTIRFTLSERATVRVSLERMRPGRRSGKRCVAPTRRLAKARACGRYATAGTLTRPGQDAGARSVRFSGRRGAKALPPGSYRATLVATDAAGNRSKAVRLGFTVVR